MPYADGAGAIQAFTTPNHKANTNSRAAPRTVIVTAHPANAKAKGATTGAMPVAPNIPAALVISRGNADGISSRRGATIAITQAPITRAGCRALPLVASRTPRHGKGYA